MSKTYLRNAFSRLEAPDDAVLELGPTDVVKCCWNPERDSLSIAEAVALGRRMSKVHFEMILVPEVLITTRIDEEFHIKNKRDFGKRMRRIMFFAVCGQAVLPWVYANTLMPYPCKFEQFLEQGGNGTVVRERSLAPEGCALQDYIRSVYGGGVIGASLVLLTMLVMCMVAQMTVFFTNRYMKSGDEKWLNYKRLMWRPLLMLWYFKISLYMPTLKYVNTINMVPCLYIPPSVLACFTYIALMLEILVLGVFNHALAITGVAAYAMGELWLHVLAFLLAAPKTHWNVMKLAMETFDEKSDDILQNMLHEDHRGDRKTFSEMASVTIHDLIQFRNLKVKSKFDLVTDRVSTEGTVDDVGVITHLLLEVFGGIYKIDLVTGHVKLAAVLGRKNRNSFQPPETVVASSQDAPNAIEAAA
mmetsp:Transcript_96130/g.190522  ORF Transcript_96130/g.190522 Transcript_96130/m.190522 type:complete len:416 (+) Transcript_96130:67-1314(+)